jgi:RNA polymerase-binding transcription factor
MTTRDTTRFTEHEALTPEQLEELKVVLAGRRKKILSAEEEQLAAVQESERLRMSDEVDLASAEYDQAFDHRIRDRERMLLKKVDKALTRMEAGEYDECESCSNYIGYKRLAARPEAVLCIECKEEQERVERQYKKRHERDTRFPFR